MQSEELRRLIYEKYGEVTRVRGFFLYTKKGVRLLDMWRSGALLGYKAGRAKREIKRELDRGMQNSFIGAAHLKLLKSLETLFRSPVHAYSLSSLEAAKEANKEGRVYLPFETPAESFACGEAFLFTPPLPLSIYFLIIRKESGEKSDMDGEFLGNASSAALSKSVYDLLRAERTLGEKDFFSYDRFLNPYFTRKRCYLSPKCKEGEYYEAIKLFLDAKIVINPSFFERTLVPWGVDAGCFRALSRAERS